MATLIKVALLAVALLKLVTAAPSLLTHAIDYYEHPKYAFNYGVNDPHTGDVKEQSEERDGDVVKGQYSLVEPDGSIRRVDYTADPINGFNAVVSKTAAIHPLPVKPVVLAKPATYVKTVEPAYVAAAPVAHYETEYDEVAHSLAGIAPHNYIQHAPLHYDYHYY